MTQACYTRLLPARFLSAVLVAVALLVSCQTVGAQTDATAPYIDDKALRESFQQDLTELRDNGRTVEMSVLRNQLIRDHTDIELPQAHGGEMPLPDLYRRCVEGVVIVGGLYMCENCKKYHLNTMTGFVVTDSGIIATACHGVVRKEIETMGVMTADGKVYAVKEVVAANRFDDIALLQLDNATGLKPLVLCPEAPIGTSVAVIAHPSSQFFMLTTGTIARYFTLNHGVLETRWISATPDIGAGASGAPLLNMSGQVVGMASRTRPVLTTPHGDEPRRVQMVIKQYVPTRAILGLLAPSGDTGQRSVDPVRQLFSHGNALMRSQSWNTIEEEAMLCVADRPDAMPLVARIAHQLTNRPEKEAQRVGERLAQHILTMDAHCVPALHALASLTMTQGRYREAERFAERMLQEQSDFAPALQILSGIAIAQGHYQEAGQFSERLLTVDPNNVMAMNNLAWVWSEQMGKHAEALELTERALKLAPDYTDLLDTHGVICRHLKHYEEAESTLKKALELSRRSEATAPASVLARFHLGQVYHETGRHEEAVRLFRECLELHETAGGLSPEEVDEAKRLSQKEPQ